jgi:hypothetical protein
MNADPAKLGSVFDRFIDEFITHLSSLFLASIELALELGLSRFPRY